MRAADDDGRNLKRRHVVVSLSGAHAYGFPSPDSDLDIKAVHIDATAELLGFPRTPKPAERLEVVDGVGDVVGGVHHGRLDRLLPDGPRQSSRSGSALDLGWMDGLDLRQPILVTAQGLFPYFRRDQVHRLIAATAERLPGSLMVFDCVPEAMLSLVRHGSGRERDLAVKLWTWLFNAHERAALSAIPGVEELRDLAPPLRLDLTSLAIAAVGRLPQRMRYSVPVFPILQARFRAASAN